MLRIAVQNPQFIFADQSRNYNGYNYVFFQKYVSVVYRLTMTGSREDEKKLYGKKIVYSPEELNELADVLICFNGEPYVYGNEPEKDFTGLKIYHAMDFVCRPEKSNKMYEDADVDYLLGYCDHSKYSVFFRKYYPRYEGRVISVPFGFGDRFLTASKSFRERKNMAVALGAVNPVNDPLCPKGVLDEYVEFYKFVEFTHELRWEISKNREKYRGEIDTEYLPEYPVTKNMSCNPVEIMNDFTMFINDLGIMNFPPARTYEGVAAGCVLVGEKSDVYTSLGFVDGVNAILFEPKNYREMIEKIRFYMNNFDKLEVLHDNAKLLLTNFTHEKIADLLYNEIERIMR